MYKYIMLILFLLLIVIIVYITLKSIIFYIKLKKSLSNALVNYDKCCDKLCIPTDKQLVQLIPQVIFIKEWQLNVAKYCSSIIYSIENSVKNNIKPNYPSDLKILKEIYENSDSTSIIGVIFSSDSVLWIAFRGSQTSEDWKNDFQSHQESFLSSQSTSTTETYINDIPVNIHKGFSIIYNNIKETIFNTLKNNDENKSKTIVVTGHSLGAALATLTGIDLFQNGYTKIVVYNFASPKVGDKLFVDLVNNSLKLYRIVNTEDIVPTLPLSVGPNIENPNKPLIYAHCGQLISFSDNWLSILNNHLMPIYMQGLENM